MGEERRDGRRSRWDGHRVARRRELIEAAVEAVRDLGPAAGMDDIAGHAGISKTVFYRYFADKADLHRAVGEAVAQWVVRQVTQAMGSEGSVRERVAAGIDCYLGIVEANAGLYAYVMHGSPPRQGATPKGSDLVEDHATILGLHVSRVIGAGLREAGADAGAAEPWGFGIVGMVRAAADRWLESPTMDRADLVAYLADLVSPGLLAAAGDGAGTTASQGSIRAMEGHRRRA